MRWEKKKSKGRAGTREGDGGKKNKMLNVFSQTQNPDSNTKGSGRAKGTNKNKVQLSIKYGNPMMNHLFYILTKTINKEKKNTS